MIILLKLILIALATLGAIALLAAGWAYFKYKQLMAEQHPDTATVEAAAWFGTTGLHEHIERELPRYLRRELGERLTDEGALQANDLKYVGAFTENEMKIHYWSMPYGDEIDVFAYVEIDSKGETCTGWGDKTPPSL
jgi:hypothetical protein